MNKTTILILFTMISCTNKPKDITNDVVNHVNKHERIDVNIWGVQNLKIIETSPVKFLPEYKNCKESFYQYNIILQEDCYENNDLKSTLEKNSVFRAIKEVFSVKSIQSKIYQTNQCLSDSWIEGIYNKEKTILNEKIGTDICTQTKSLFNRECIQTVKYTRTDYEKELNDLQRNLAFDMSLMTKHIKGESFFKKDRVIYCEDSSGGIIFP